MKERYRNPSLTVSVNERRTVAAAILGVMSLRFRDFGDPVLAYAFFLATIVVFFSVVSIAVDVGGPVEEERQR